MWTLTTAWPLPMCTIPTLLIIKDGEIMDTMVGATSKDAILQRLRPVM